MSRASRVLTTAVGWILMSSISSSSSFSDFYSSIFITWSTLKSFMLTADFRMDGKVSFMSLDWFDWWPLRFSLIWERSIDPLLFLNRDLETKAWSNVSARALFSGLFKGSSTVESLAIWWSFWLLIFWTFWTLSLFSKFCLNLCYISSSTACIII